MADDSVAHQRSIDRATATRAAVAVGVLVIFAAILGPTVLVPPTASPGGSASASGVPPSGAAATGGPAASAEPWADLTLEPFAATAELVADDHDRIGIGTTTSFTLRSLTATPAVELARGLQVDPPTALTVEPGASADVARVRPKSPLVAGLRYRVRLAAADGALAGTWAFVTRAPLHVVGTLPADLATSVPANTGIEITFDQDGVTGVADHVTIKPAVSGRFEAHGRTWAFVPDKPLAAGAIYVVTVHKGIGLSGSTEILESDRTFKFETAVASTPVSRVEFGRSMIEIRPDGQPTVIVTSSDSHDGESSAPDSIGIQIHRLPDFKAVIAAGVALAGPDAWAIAAPSATVSTAGLTRVADVKASILSTDAGSLMTMPVHLAKGAYVVTITQPGAPAQLLVQVTNLSAYALAATATTVAWVNDLAGNTSIAGATVSIADGRSLGTTGADGVLRVATPADLRSFATPGADDAPPAAARFLAISAAGLGSLLVPLGLPVPYGYPSAGSWWYGPDAQAWWLQFATDRTTYRQTDTVHVYGTIRARSDRSVPTGLELRLRPAQGSADAPIMRVPVVATARGVFTADVRLADLPAAQYDLDLYVGSEVVSSVWIFTGGIVKPAYRVDVQTDRHAYMAGDSILVSTTTTFYDGTPVPGLDLDFSIGGDSGASGPQAHATTDALGRATVALHAASTQPEGLGHLEINVAPADPEEGEIGGTTNVRILPAQAWIGADGTVSGGNVTVTGKLSWLDMAAYEAALAAGNDPEPSGAPIAGGSLQAEVVHVVPIRTQTGTTYDFVEKKVVPTYEYEDKEVSLGTQTLRSAADGTFRLSMPAPVPADTYRIRLSTVDPEGRTMRRSLDVAAPQPAESYLATYLEVPGGCGVPSIQSGLDAGVKLTMRQGDGNAAAGGPFLFVVGERGSLETTVQDSATFTRALRDADLPGFTTRGVWLSSDGYRVGDVSVEVAPKDKTLAVRLRADRTSYQPGDPVTIDVTTIDPAGKPVAADVVVTGVDEKLYALGDASDIDPVGELMAGVSPGFLASYQSHAVPMPAGGGCGGTGGEGRSDFRDAITFQRITTDAGGHGSVSFKLSDDLTSWHVSAIAVSAALDAGQASVLVPVGLPFFADAALAPEYLAGDIPILRLRGYGAGIAAGDHVRFVVSAPSLGLAPTTVEGNAFDAVRVALPKLVVGDHAIRIEASATHGGSTLTDILIRTVHVVSSRLGTVAASYDLLGADFRPQGGEGLTTYVITDAGRGRLIAPLRDLAASTSARFDRNAAAEIARTFLVREFDVPEASLAATGFDPTRYQNDAGVALLPYASVDLFLGARAALVATSVMDLDQLRRAFQDEIDNSQTSNRERQIVALAGLAGIGDDVLERLRTYDPATLTVREQLWLGLGFAASGDEATARSIERSVLEARGQRLGPWVRLAVGATVTDTLEASSLLLLLAARLGDPIAADVSRYLADQPSSEQVFPLEQLGYIQGVLDRLPRAAGRFAWTVDGQRHEVQLDPGGAMTLVLTPSQRVGLRLEPLAGELAVATTWTASGGGLPSDPTMSVTRTINPAGSASDTQLVKVTLTVTFGAQAPGGCYRLTDLLPSGLSPVVASAGWSGEEAPTVIRPYDIEGQRVSWCVSPADTSHVYGYSARVVTPGTYTWEPAVVQSETAPTVGSSTALTTYTIR